MRAPLLVVLPLPALAAVAALGGCDVTKELVVARVSTAVEVTLPCACVDEPPCNPVSSNDPDLCGHGAHGVPVDDCFGEKEPGRAALFDPAHTDALVVIEGADGRRTVPVAPHTNDGEVRGARNASEVLYRLAADGRVGIGGQGLSAIEPGETRVFEYLDVGDAVRELHTFESFEREQVSMYAPSTWECGE